MVGVGRLNRREDISPTVGLRHEAVANLWYDALNLPKYDYSAAIGGNVGYILGEEFRTWHPPATVDEVVEAIERGFDRLRPFMSLDRMPAAFDEFEIVRVKPGINYELVCIAVVQRDKAAVTQTLELAHNRYCRESGGVCDQFLKFEKIHSCPRVVGSRDSRGSNGPNEAINAPRGTALAVHH